MKAQSILKDLIEDLYERSSTAFNFPISAHGNNYLEADDGTPMGNLGGQYDSDSIFNPYGQYGSRYSPESIFNPYGQYGSRYLPGSPLNPYSMTPPKIFINGLYFGKLTMNKHVPDAKATDIFLFYVLNNLGLLEDRMEDFLDLVSRS